MEIGHISKNLTPVPNPTLLKNEESREVLLISAPMTLILPKPISHDDSNQMPQGPMSEFSAQRKKKKNSALCLIHLLIILPEDKVYTSPFQNDVIDREPNFFLNKWMRSHPKG